MFMRVISTGSHNGNCYTLTASNGDILLLDLGCDSSKILQGIDWKVSNVCGALLTHEHG